jgi:hypothetical protein
LQTWYGRLGMADLVWQTWYGRLGMADLAASSAYDI